MMLITRGRGYISPIENGEAAPRETGKPLAFGFGFASDSGAYAMIRQDERIAKLLRLQEHASKLFNLLTPRESDVVALWATGDSSKTIGKKLGISYRTVEIHKANIHRRLRTKTLAAIVTLWVYASLPLQDP